MGSILQFQTIVASLAAMNWQVIDCRYSFVYMSSYIIYWQLLPRTTRGVRYTEKKKLDLNKNELKGVRMAFETSRALFLTQQSYEKEFDHPLRHWLFYLRKRQNISIGRSETLRYLQLLVYFEESGLF